MVDNPYFHDECEVGRPAQCVECAQRIAWREGHDSRDAEVAALKSQLEPSPCGREGHRRCDWVPTGAPETMYQQQTHYHCLSCNREKSQLAEARLDEAKWWYQYAYWFKDKKPAPACDERIAALKAQGGKSE